MEEERKSYLSIDDMVERGVYRIHSRNLSVGVWNGKNGFIGIREKFGDEFLFTEYHYDAGPPFGTVRPHELIAMLPEDIEVTEILPPRCSICNRLVNFHREEGEAKGTWVYADDGTEMHQEGIPQSSRYHPLFDFLKQIEKSE